MAGQNRSNFNSDFIGDRSTSQYRDNMLHKQMHDTAEEGYERPFKVYVGNLPQDITQGDIIDVFQQINVVAKNVHLARDKENDAFRGYCYVEFEDLNDMKVALENNGLILNSHSLKINLANRGRGGRGGRGGPGSQGGYNRQSSAGSGGHHQGYSQGRGAYNQDRGGHMTYRGSNHGNYSDRGGHHHQGHHHQGQGHDFNQRGAVRTTQQNDYNQGGFNNSRNNRVQRLGPPNDEEIAVEDKQAYNESLKGRKKLVLKPRSKETKESSESAQRSSIFGKGKAKDHNVEPTTKDL